MGLTGILLEKLILLLLIVYFVNRVVTSFVKLGERQIGTGMSKKVTRSIEESY